jgi:hypothetical protein
MTRSILAVAAAFATTATAAAQPNQYQYPTYPPAGPYYQPQNVMPNIYNPANQPLSPYLLTTRGGTTPYAAVGYYFGTRPGTSGGSGFGLGAPFTAPGGNRPLFFPQLANAPDPFTSREVGAGDVLPPAGHPVVFSNTLGFYPSQYGGRGSPQSGLANLGNSGQRPSTSGTSR